MQQERRLANLLQQLIPDNRDAQEGYREAVEQTSDQELRAFFSEQSLERSEFVSALQLRLPIGKSAPTVLRKWVDADRNPAQGDVALLEALEAGEAEVRADYEEALRQDLPGELKRLLQQQCETVKCAHDHLRLMRNRLAQGKEAA